MIELESSAWKSFVSVEKNVLENRKSKIYWKLVANMPLEFRHIEANAKNKSSLPFLSLGPLS